MAIMTREALRRALVSARPETPAPEGFRPCAVLVPILGGGEEPRLLFMERAAQPLDPHSGQISFPGGRREEGDADAAATASRETEEELGLPARVVEVLGRLEETLTPTGYCITPVVGWIERLPALRPDAREVAGVFDVPLARLADASCRFPRGEHRIGGRAFEVFEYRAAGRVIWGATARIVATLLALA
ncbi:MAG: CoA pyrophosphatase [Elusimicrobia bacterium]|nr:CoA pyrophosphatase [Elusimicrobiota bacterium]